jgi:hypothetical protein
MSFNLVSCVRGGFKKRAVAVSIRLWATSRLAKGRPCRWATHDLPCKEPFHHSWPMSRGIQSMAQNKPHVSRPAGIVTPSQGPQDSTGDSDVVSQAEQRRTDWSVIRKLLQHVWPRNDWYTRGRVLLGFGLLISGKVCGTPSVIYLDHFQNISVF